MNESRSPGLVMVFLLLLALACFISAPVFSAEDPWDADSGDDGGDGDNSDSTDTSGIPDIEKRFDQGGPDWYSWMIFQLSYGIATYFSDGSYSETSGMSQRKAVLIGRSSSSGANKSTR